MERYAVVGAPLNQERVGMIGMAGHVDGGWMFGRNKRGGGGGSGKG